MSGTNRALMSSIVGKKGSESALKKVLDNANEEAKKLDPKGKTKEK